MRRRRGWLYTTSSTSPFVTSAALRLLLEAEQLRFGDQAQLLRPAQPVLAGRLRSHRLGAVTFEDIPALRLFPIEFRCHVLQVLPCPGPSGDSRSLWFQISTDASGTLRYMISYMISKVL